MATSWWIGRAADLRELHSDGLSVSRTPDRSAAVHKLISGQRVDRSIRSTRSWQLSWTWSAHPDWAVLYALYDGQLGPGPYWLIDPTVRNHLSPDHATGGLAVGDTAAWTTLTTAETLSVGGAVGDVLGLASLNWQLPTSPTQGVLELPHISGFRRPTAVGWEWTFWQRAANFTGLDTTIDARAEIVWYDSSGPLTTSTGTYAPLGVSAYTRHAVTATAPADAQGFVLRLRLDLTDITPGVAANIRIGRARLIQGPDDATWYPGQGLPRVSIASQDDALPQGPDYASTAWSLVEVI